MIPWRYSPCQREQSTLTQCEEGGDTTGMFGLSMKAWCDAENKDLGYAEMNARESSAAALQCCLGLEVNQTVSSRWITMSRFAGIRFKDCGTTASTARPPTCVLGCGQGFFFFFSPFFRAQPGVTFRLPLLLLSCACRKRVTHRAQICK